MAKPMDLHHELRQLTFLYGRTPETPMSEEEAAFGNLGTCGGGEIYLGAFSGESPWERHSSGDELVHVLNGRATITILMDDGPEEHDLTGGTVLIVPQGRWHRFVVEQSVTVMTVTPPPTEHSVERP